MSTDTSDTSLTEEQKKQLEEHKENLKLKLKEISSDVKVIANEAKEKAGAAANEAYTKAKQAYAKNKENVLLTLITNPNKLYKELDAKIEEIDKKIPTKDDDEKDKDNTKDNQINRAINMALDEYKEIIKDNETKHALLKFVKKGGEVVLVKVPKILGIIINVFLTALGGIPFIGIPITLLRASFNAFNGAYQTLGASTTAIEASQALSSIPNIKKIQTYLKHIKDIFANLGDDASLKSVLDGMQTEIDKRNTTESKTKEEKSGSGPQTGGKKNKKMNKISLCIENSFEEFNKTTSNPELFLGKVKKSSKRSKMYKNK
jgi:hypothetical protein